MVDNLQYTRGAHALTAGITIQWQEINNANPATYTGILQLGFNAADTSQFGTNSSTLTTTGSTGNAYASYLLGAVGGSPTLGLQPVSEEGGRYRPIAPYLEDTWKVNHKLTVDAGLRWDYLPPYHEVKDRWSFLNPTEINPATGNPGALEFAGSAGGAGVSCGCRTPVNTYFANYGPRLGITYAFNDKTLLRAGIGRVFSQGGGVGGRGGAYQGTGQLGFNTTATAPSEVLTGTATGPSFYLNNSSTFTSLGIANTALGFTYPTAPTPGSASLSLDAGNYVNATTGKYVTPSAAPGYADPYFSGRAPDFTFFNVGIEQAFTNTLTMSLNYVGNQSHHLYNSTVGGANIRGYWANQLNPIYLAGLGGVSDSTGKNPILTSAATAVNVQKALAAMPGINIPTSYQNAAALNTSATIAQALVAFPQYATTADTWGVNTANFSYHSLQVTFQQRLSHGLTLNANYTWSHNIGDDGTFRSGFDIPANALSGGDTQLPPGPHRAQLHHRQHPSERPRLRRLPAALRQRCARRAELHLPPAPRRLAAVLHPHLRLRSSGRRHRHRLQLAAAGAVHGRHQPRSSRQQRAHQWLVRQKRRWQPQQLLPRTRRRLRCRRRQVLRLHRLQRSAERQSCRSYRRQSTGQCAPHPCAHAQQSRRPEHRHRYPQGHQTPREHESSD